MKTTREFLAAIKQRHHLKTDGDLHRLLGLSRERISRYQKGQDYFGEETALKVAEALDVSPGYVLACVSAERAKTEAIRKAWQRVAATAAVFVLAVSLAPQIGGELDSALPYFESADLTTVYYVKSAAGLAILFLIALALYLADSRPALRRH